MLQAYYKCFLLHIFSRMIFLKQRFKQLKDISSYLHLI